MVDDDESNVRGGENVEMGFIYALTSVTTDT